MRWQTLVVSLTLIVAGCRGTAPGGGEFEARAGARRFEIAGSVVAVDRDARRITIAHGEVKGFMDAMTMPFAIKERWAFDAAAPGDALSGTLVVDGSRAWIEGVSIVRGNRAAAGAPAKGTWVPADPGTPLPDVALVDQDNRPLSLTAWRGQPFLITFSYTRCPLEEYCPLMMQRFAAIEKATARDPALRQTRLLTVTLDPEHDPPARLREYGSKYATGQGAADPFSRWRLATGTPEHVKQLAAFFGLDYYTEPAGRVVHSLRTAVIDRDGRVSRVFESNSWTTKDVLDALRAVTPPAS